MRRVLQEWGVREEQPLPEAVEAAAEISVCPRATAIIRKFSIATEMYSRRVRKGNRVHLELVPTIHAKRRK